HRRPCTVCLLDDQRQSSTRLEGRLLDLSAGGLRLESSTLLETGTQVVVLFQLDEEPPISAVFSVLATEGVDAADAGPETWYISRGSFTSLKDDDRHRIFQYVLSRRRQAALTS